MRSQSLDWQLADWLAGIFHVAPITVMFAIPFIIVCLTILASALFIVYAIRKGQRQAAPPVARPARAPFWEESIPVVVPPPVVARPWNPNIKVKP